MIFSMEAGSKGCGKDVYVLYLPFQLVHAKIDFSTEPKSKKLSRGISACLEKVGAYQSLTIGPFNSQENALAYFKRGRISLLLMVGTLKS